MLKSLLNKIFGREGNLEYKALFNFGVKNFSSVLGFGIFWMLAQLLEPDELGHYQYAFTITMIISMVAVFGFDRLLVREIPRYETHQSKEKIRGFMQWTGKIIIPISIGLSLVALAVSFAPIPFFEDPTTRSTFRLAMISIPMLGIIVHQRSALTGLKKVVIASFPEKLVQPGVLFSVLAVIYLFIEDKLSAEWAVIINVVALTITAVVAITMLQRSKPQSAVEEPSSEERKQFWASSLPILGFNLSMLIFARTDILMLRSLESPEAVGIYSIPFKLASYIGFILVAYNGVIGPEISAHFKSGAFEKLQKAVTKMARTTALLAIPLSAILIFGRGFLGDIFGAPYAAGEFTLMLLVLGQLVNVLCGPVGNILIMTNHEWLAMISFGVSTVLNVAINFWLIPTMGIGGAAIGTAVSMVFSNLLMLVLVKVKLNLNPTILRF